VRVGGFAVLAGLALAAACELEIAAPFSTPVRSVLVARSEISLPLPELDDVTGASEDLPRTLGWSPALLFGPGTETPTLASMVEATSCAAPGRLPAKARPVVPARATVANAVASLSRGTIDLLRGFLILG
jgi:hypothetical protein